MNSTKRSRRFPYGWIILILVIALLYATNPSEPQFTSYLKDKSREQAEGDETLSGELQRMLAGPAASLAEWGQCGQTTIYALFIRWICQAENTFTWDSLITSSNLNNAY